MDIRAATPDDFDAIVAVMDEWWGRPIRSILQRMFLDHFHCTSLVATDGDGLAGFLIGFGSPDRDGEGYVHAAAISPLHRRSGLGRELYQRFFALMRDADRPVVRAVTAPANQRSIAFHRGIGFAVSEPEPDYDGPGQDRVVFRIDLRD